ncbi:hypothetical protein [Streptomyces sp. DH41]|uniref:hypothetical protein n=1 Tax=Streptomyces sp. DH41 TaxID=3040125 RepID=UPI002442ADB2|nr:hypothetical protein [Streptomyces sp. DH41]MDG9721669.1 hypothetical protein [Streptomyces sp. DH41]
MGKRVSTVLGTLAASFMLATVTPSSAWAADNILEDERERGWFMYSRSCGSVYSLELTTTRAVGIKHNSGCAGHVWVRMYGDSWGDWRHDSREKTLTSPRGKFKKALIKGCADCHAYTVYPKN